MNAEKPRVSLVTGAATGMGRALVARLARRGQPVVAVDIKKDEFAWAANFPGVHAVTADLTRQADNAALSLKGDVLEMPMEDFDRMFAINVRGVALGLRAGIPALRRRGGGAIVVTAVMEFLISPGSSFMTGAVVPVDGGILAHLGTQDLPGA